MTTVEREPGPTAAPSTPGRVPVLGWILGAGLLLALVAVLHVAVGWRALAEPWLALPPWNVAAAFGLVLASYAVRTVRIHQYFAPATRGEFLRSFRLVLLHNLFNNLLPMRSGEASFPILMRREFAVPMTRSLPGLFYLRVLDLHFLLVLVAVALAGEGGPLWWGAALLLAPLPLAAFLLQERVRPALGKREGRVAALLAEAATGLPTSSRLFWGTWLWTGVNWGVKLLVFAWILGAFLPELTYAAALLGSVTGEMSSVLPFHGLAGAGTYEAGIMAGLVPAGLPLERGITGAVNLHLFVLGASVLSGVLALVLPVGKARDRSVPGSGGADPRKAGAGPSEQTG